MLRISAAGCPCCLCGYTDARRAVPCVGFLLAFQTQPHTGQGPTTGFGDGFAAFFAKSTALAPGQTGPGPPYLVSYGILDLVLHGIVARPAYRHGAPRKCSAVIPPRCRLAATGTDYSHAPRSKARRCCRMQGIVLTPPSFLLTLGHSCEHRRLWAAMAGGHHAYPFLLTHAPDSRGEICAFRHVCRKRMVLAAPRQRKTFPGDAFEVRCCPASPACRFPAPFLDDVSRYAPGACCRGPVPHTRTPSSAGVPGSRRRVWRVSRCCCNSPHFPYERSS